MNDFAGSLVHLLRHERMEPLDGLEPPAFPVRTTLWPGELQRHELGNQGSNLDSLASGASVLPGYTIPHQIGEDSVRRQGFEPRTLPIKSRML